VNVILSAINVKKDIIFLMTNVSLTVESVKSKETMESATTVKSKTVTTVVKL